MTLNGANVTATTSVNTSAPYSTNEPLFTVPGALSTPGQKLILKFTAKVASGTPAGTYCNSYTSVQNGMPLTTGSLACITVGAAQIGDTIFRDWNGDGVRDPGEEGIAGVTVECAQRQQRRIATTTTDANGNYLFEGLAAGTYTVKVTDLVRTDFPPTATRVAATPRPTTPTAPTPAACNGQPTVTLITGDATWTRTLAISRPARASSAIRCGRTTASGGQGRRRVQDGGETGIANATVQLYEDTNGNGAIDPDDVLVATAVTNGSGNYGFTRLAGNLNYLVKIDETDPDFTAAF